MTQQDGLRRGWRVRPWWLAGTAVMALGCSAHAQWSFMPLGTLSQETETSFSGGISDDGRYVVGVSGGKAVRWSVGTGIAQAISIAGLATTTDPTGSNLRLIGCSADGGTIIGIAPNTSGGGTGFRYRVSDGTYMVVSSSNPGAGPIDISADGSTVVGQSSTNGAYQWTVGAGFDSLTDMIPGAMYLDSYAAGLSRSNTWVCTRGLVIGAGDPETACHVYSRLTGQVDVVAFAPGGTTAIHPNAISGDGRTIVGTSDGKAVRWTRSGGTAWLERNTGGEQPGSTIAVSGNGRVAVGSDVSWNHTMGGFATGNTAFLWTDAHGARPLSEVLEEAGVSLGGWTLSAATGLSADGRVVCGHGLDAGGRRGAWIVKMPAVACPADIDDGLMSGQSNDVVDVGDLLYFLDRYEAGSERADLDDGNDTGIGDDAVDLNDLLYFLDRFEQGC